MKKIIGILLASLTLMSLAACQNSSDSSQTSKNSGTSSGDSSAASQSGSETASSEQASEVSIAEAAFNIKKDYGDSTKLSEYMDLDILTDKTKTDVLDRLAADSMTMDVTGKIAIGDGINITFNATVAHDGDNSYFKTRYGSEESVVIRLGDVTYALDDDNKQAVKVETIDKDTVSKDPVNSQVLKYLTQSFELENLKYHENGVAEYKDELLTYEEYTSDKSTLRLYYDGNDLKYISNLKEGLESVITINSLTDTSDKTLFELPADYQIVSEQEASSSASSQQSSDASMSTIS